MPVYDLKVNEDRKKLVEAVIKDMKKGEPFFWNSGHYGSLNRPRNLKNNIKGKDKPYKGINAMTLMYYGMKKGYKDARWCTFKQAEELGFKIKEGEHGVPIEYWEFKGPKKEYNKKTKKWEPVYEVDEEGNKKPVIVTYTKPVVRRYVVFNAEQMEGVPALEMPFTISDEDRNVYFENMINNSEAPIFFDQSSRNYYSPSMDEIHVMPREQFKDMDFFYGTVTHEVAHSTGAADRNNRPGITGFTGFGSETYAKEELVAEMAAMFLSSEFGLTVDMDHMENHKAYLRSWVKALKEDPDELFRAASQAEQAVDYIKEHMLLKDIELVKNTNFKVEPIDKSIRAFYMSAYPDDDLGERIADISFRKLYAEMKKKKDVYDVIEVGDSIVRERVFKKLAEITGQDYSEIYDLWLESSKIISSTKSKPQKKSKKVKSSRVVDLWELAEKVTDTWAKENLSIEGLPDSIINKPKLTPKDIDELGEYYNHLRFKYQLVTSAFDMGIIGHMINHGLTDNRIKIIFSNCAAKYPGYPSSEQLADMLKSSEIKKYSHKDSVEDMLKTPVVSKVKVVNM